MVSLTHCAIALFVQLAWINPISAFDRADVLVSAVVLPGLIAHEGLRAGVRHWWIAIVATCSVGVSLGLPLFLWLRERRTT